MAAAKKNQEPEGRVHITISLPPDIHKALEDITKDGISPYATKSAIINVAVLDWLKEHARITKTGHYVLLDEERIRPLEEETNAGKPKPDALDGGFAGFGDYFKD